jgi:hypothetical protein
MPRRVRPGASPTDTGDACPWRERPGLPRIARIMPMTVRGRAWLLETTVSKPQPADNWRVATAQETFSQLRAQHLRPGLSALGLKARSRTTWLNGNPDRGWVVVNFGGNRRNTREVGEWSVSVWGWPPGTWEWEIRREQPTVPEPDSRVAPLYAGPDRVLGHAGGERPDVVELVADMNDQQIAEAARVLLDYTETACSWVETLFDSDRADDFTWDTYVLGAAATTGRWTSSRLELLERLTTRAQCGAGNPAWDDLVRWRAAAGLQPVPLPRWHHPLMKPEPPIDRFTSPRAALEAGHGRAVHIRRADGSTRPPRPEDFPDERQLALWQATQAALNPDGPVMVLPDWLPWIDWVTRAGDRASALKSWTARFRSRWH